jgi:hypothetical protein
MNDVQDGGRGLALCPTHDAHMRYWFDGRHELAMEHLWRLWIERGLALYRTVAAPSVAGDMVIGMQWLRRHCERRAGGCPICFDFAPYHLLARLERATRETLLDTSAQWIVRGDQALPVLVGAGVAYLARLEAVEMKAGQGSAIGAWWN